MPNPRRFLLGSKRRRQDQVRRLRMESLETRQLLTAAFRNSVDNLDVNNDRKITPLDALLVINDLSRNGIGALPDLRPPNRRFIDVNGDNRGTSLDALIILNHMARYGIGERRVTDGDKFDSEQTIDIELGLTNGSRLYKMEIDANFGTPASQGVLPDLFSVYLVNPSNSSTTLLDRGVNGTSLFSMSATKIETAPGLARWDGNTLELDLSSVTEAQYGRLRIQLINGDSASRSTVVVRPLSNAVDTELSPGQHVSFGSTPANPSGALDLSTLTEAATIEATVENLRFDSSLGLFIANVGITNLGAATGRDVAIVLHGLPNGVTIQNASGLDGTGSPYINLRDAIRDGGLDTNSQSGRVELRISNPNRSLLNIRPQFLVGKANRAPALELVPDQTVVPGSRIGIQLDAVDPDNDHVTYSFFGAAPLPRGTLNSATGQLEFSPTPDQLGIYQVGVSASDGVLTTTREFSLMVNADPISTTRVSGRILDIDQTPLPGIRVEIGGVQAITTVDGAFRMDLGNMPLVTNTLKIHGESFDDPNDLNLVYPFIAEKLPLLLDHDIYVGFNNVISRPIFLPKLDIANGKPIDPTQDTIVTTAAIPGAALTVAAGSLTNQQGSAFNGTLSITEVPADLTPAAFPPNLFPDLVVTIQPGEMVFTTPSPLTLPNRTGFSPGTLLDLWSINPVTGAFEIVGTGQVSSDGSVVETIAGGVRNSSWHAFILQVTTVRTYTENPGCETNSCSVPGASSIDLQTGAITESYEVASYAAHGGTQRVSLVYDSLRADPQPIIHFETITRCISISTGGANARQFLIADIDLSQDDFSGIIGTNSWQVPSCTSGDELTLSASIQADMSTLQSGQYNFTLNSGILTQVGNQPVAGRKVTNTGSFSVVNFVNSSFGSGWGIAGLQQLVKHHDGSILLIDGGGSELYFQAPSIATEAYKSPVDDFSTLIKLEDGRYLRTLKDQTVYEFNSSLGLASVRDRNGNTTTYDYTNGVLKRIVDPVGLETHFEYTNGKLARIIDPFGRTTTLHHDLLGNLVRITEPDGTSMAWDYDNLHRPIRSTDKLGRIGSDSYDAAGRSNGANFSDGSNSRIQPIMVQGLVTSGGLGSTSDTSHAFYASESGNIMEVTFNQTGDFLRLRDTYGPIISVQRDQRDLITPSVDGEGNFTEFTYDNRGNVTSVSDAVANADFSPTISWIGGISNDWKDAANWSAGPLPVPTDDVLIDVVGSTLTIQIMTGAVTVHNLRVRENLLLSGASLTVTGRAIVSQLLTLKLGATVVVQGANSVFSAIGETQISETNLRALDGGKLLLPNAVSFNGGIAFNSSLTFEARGLGSVLDLSGLQGFVGRSGGDSSVHTIRATLGGQIIMNRIPSITGHTGITVDGSGSLIDLASTSVMTEGGITVRGEGRINSPLLELLDHVSVNLNGTGYFQTNQIRSFTNGTLTLSGVSPDLNALASIEGSTLNVSGISPNLDAVTNANRASMVASNGGQIRLPNVTSYDGGPTPCRGFCTLRLEANDANSVLDLSSVTTFVGFSGLGANQLIKATKGGQILLTKTESISVGPTGLSVDGGQSLIDLSSLIQMSNGSISATNTGRINNPVLESLDGVSVTLNGTGSVETKQIKSIINGTLTLSGVNPDMSALTSLKGSTLTVDGISPNFDTVTDVDVAQIIAINGGQIRLPNILTYEGGDLFCRASCLHRLEARDPNSLVDLSNATVFHSATGFARTQTVRALNGGQILLNQVSSITGSANFTADGNNSAIDVGNLTSMSMGSILVQNQGGVLSSNLVVLDSVTVIAKASGSINLHEVQSWTNGTANLTGGTYDFESLITAVGTDFTVDAATVNALLLTDITNGTVRLLNGGVFNAPLIDDLPLITGGGEGEGPLSPEEYLALMSQQVAFTTVEYPALSRELPEGEPDTAAPAIPGPATGPRTYTYDSVFNQLINMTDELGRSTLFTLDPLNGNTLSSTQVVGLLDVPGGESDDISTRFTYTAQGYIDTVTDPLGRITDLDYDAFGRVTLITWAKGTTDEATERYEYDSVGNRSAVIDPLGRRTEYFHNTKNNRLEKVRDSLGQEMLLRYDAKGNLIEQTDVRGNTWKFDYDMRDRLTKVTDPLSQIYLYDYDRSGNLIRSFDPLNHVTRHEYDLRDRRTATIDADGGITRFKYDLNNNLISLTDPVGNQTLFEYDSRNRMIGETDPFGKSIVYDYDAADNLIRKVDRLGRETLYTYDDVDRLVKETWGDGSNEVTYEYDKTGNLHHVKDSYSELTYTYDSLDRVKSFYNTGTPSIPEVILAYAHDLIGNVTSVTDTINGTAGAVTAYAYDSLDRLRTLTQSGTELSNKRVDFTYNEMSQFEHIKRYQDLAATQLVIDTIYSYDTINRLQSIDHNNSDGDAVSFFHYTYDMASRVSSITDVDGLTSYGYDARDQLTSADHDSETNSDEFYQYDANGNRLASHLPNSGYFTGKANRLLSDGTYNYAYDDEGNTISRTEIATNNVRDFQWDFRNRLTAVIDKDANGTVTQEVRFTYDVFDRRISKSVDTNPADSVDAAVMSFIYDREDVILDFIDSDGSGPLPSQLSERYLHGPGIDQVLAQDDASGSAQWHLTNHLGSVSDLVQNSGSVVSHSRYDSFGNVLLTSNNSGESRYLFTGREFDPETSLSYFRSRYYESNTGRFSSEDAYRIRAGWNNYRYVENTPLLQSDPHGTEPVSIVGKWRVPTKIPDGVYFGNRPVDGYGVLSHQYLLLVKDGFATTASWPTPGTGMTDLTSALNRHPQYLIPAVPPTGVTPKQFVDLVIAASETYQGGSWSWWPAAASLLKPKSNFTNCFDLSHELVAAAGGKSPTLLTNQWFLQVQNNLMDQVTYDLTYIPGR